MTEIANANAKEEIEEITIGQCVVIAGVGEMMKMMQIIIVGRITIIWRKVLRGEMDVISDVIKEEDAITDVIREVTA